MNILFFSTMNGSPWGGSEELWYRTALLAKKQNHNVWVLYKYWGEATSNKLKEIQDLNIHTLFYDRPQKSNNKLTGTNRFKSRINKLLPFTPKKNITREENLSDHDSSYIGLIPENTDLICFSLGGTYDLVNKQKFRTWVLQLKIPYIFISQFNYDYGYALPQQNLEAAKQIFQKAQKIIFVSRKNKEFAEHQICTRLNNTVIINNPQNINDHSYIPYIENKKIHFTIVSRLHCKTKAIDIIIRCFAQEKWKSRPWILNIYGDGPDKKYISELIKFYELTEKIKLCGITNNIREIWKKSNILILPSIAEGTPLSLQEAMFCGRTAIVTDIAGNTELIKEGENGFVAEAPSYNSLSNAIDRAWENNNEWEMMGKKAHQFILDNVSLNPEKNLMQLIDSLQL